ncbi:pilus assembly protein PilM [Limnohabitans sp. DM1]|uniref:pilus assembly protein PilM n=1 Tax=Limnohabitans sp. DM1 TaxID=1597955 RepID=UPI000B11EAFD|nr:pilus assembly protein PilM [Limnohabitans sp. DM1]
MKGLIRWWQRIGARSTRLGWGLAQQDAAWSLVGLQRQSEHLAKVQSTQTLQPMPALAHQDKAWLSQALRQMGSPQSGVEKRLNMALPLVDLALGQIEFPAQLDEGDWVAEVQLEAAQALGLEPDEVNFDFQPEDTSRALVRRVQWVACAKSHIADLKKCTRAAGWQLATVEPELHAARRAANALQGGLPSLLTQPVLDWQFRLPGPDDGPHIKEAAGLATGDAALLQAMSSPVGARLVAAGLALKAWS